MKPDAHYGPTTSSLQKPWLIARVLVGWAGTTASGFRVGRVDLAGVPGAVGASGQGHLQGDVDFPMSYEVEMKFRTDGHADLVRRLAELGCRRTATEVVQEDAYLAILARLRPQQ